MLKRIDIRSAPIKLQPGDIEYPVLCFLIDDQWAIATDGFYVSLVEVIPDYEKPGAYRRKGYIIIIAIDDKRTVEGLKEIVKQLKSMSAYELLTKHYNATSQAFFLNRERLYEEAFEADDHPPVNLEIPYGRY